MLQLPVSRSQGHVCSHAHCFWQFSPYQPMGHSGEWITNKSVTVKAPRALKPYSLSLQHSCPQLSQACSPSHTSSELQERLKPHISPKDLCCTALSGLASHPFFSIISEPQPCCLAPKQRWRKASGANSWREAYTHVQAHRRGGLCVCAEQVGPQVSCSLTKLC